MWELWEAPKGRRHLVIGGQARCVKWWPGPGWRRVPEGYIGCMRCQIRVRGSYVTQGGRLIARLEAEARGQGEADR